MSFFIINYSRVLRIEGRVESLGCEEPKKISINIFSLRIYKRDRLKLICVSCVSPREQFRS